jgi:hypothetical protein
MSHVAWQCGTNENTSGILRPVTSGSFPHRSDELVSVAALVDSRPCKTACWGGNGGTLGWPADVPIKVDPSVQTTERQESLIIVLANARQDLSNLETPTRGEPSKRELSELEEILAEVRTGVRETPTEVTTGRNALRYRVERIEFLLGPTR